MDSPFEHSHSAIGYIAPHNRLARRHAVIFVAHDKKLESARQIHKIKRQQPTG